MIWIKKQKTSRSRNKKNNSLNNNAKKREPSKKSNNKKSKGSVFRFQKDSNNFKKPSFHLSSLLKRKNARRRKRKRI